MELSFYKVKIFRNDFLLIGDPSAEVARHENIAHIVKRLCRRRIGVGATGVILVGETGPEGTSLRFYGSDGSSMIPSADALLCAARYLFDSGRSDGHVVPFLIRSGAASVGVLDSNQLRVDLGRPHQVDSGAPLDPSPTHDFSVPVLVEERTYYVTPITCGTACQVFLPVPVHHGLKAFDRKVKSESPFADALPLYVRPFNPEEQRVFAWPVNEPVDCCALAACGAVSSILNGYADGIVLVRYGADSAFVDWNIRANRVTATASPRYVFAGEYHYEEN